MFDYREKWGIAAVQARRYRGGVTASGSGDDRPPLATRIGPLPNRHRRFRAYPPADRTPRRSHPRTMRFQVCGISAVSSGVPSSPAMPERSPKPELPVPNGRAYAPIASSNAQRRRRGTVEAGRWARASQSGASRMAVHGRGQEGLGSCPARFGTGLPVAFMPAGISSSRSRPRTGSR